MDSRARFPLSSRRGSSLAAAAGALLVALAHATAPAPARAQQPAWTVEAHTGPVRELAFEATEGTWMSVDVSPDGAHIVFDLLGTIYEVPVLGGDAVALTSGRSWNLSPRYSPDGRQIAFSSDRTGSHQVWVLDRESGEVRQVSEWPDANIYRPSWSDDGEGLYAGVSGDGIASQLVAFDLDGGGGPESLIAGQGPVNGAQPLASGRGFLFEHHAEATYPFGFNPYVIPPGGSRIEWFDEATGTSEIVVERPGGAFQPTLSPSGSALAYVHRALEGTVLMLLDLETREERVLLTGLDRDRQDTRQAYGPYPNLAWYEDGSGVVLGYEGGLASVDVVTGTVWRIPFSAPVRREMSETIRFATTLPEDRARTRTHRWGRRVADGVISEALGDLWLHDESGATNLTRSDAHETSPVVDPASGAIYFASWTDDELGSVRRMDLADGGSGDGRSADDALRLTAVASQYGSLALSPDRTELAFVRGTGGLHQGRWLSNQTQFELVLLGPEGERRLTGVEGQPLEYANIAGKIPPAVVFGPEGDVVYFTEFENDVLVLKRIGTDGAGERTLYVFPHAVDAVPSPDMAWMAVREYHRSFILPFDPGDEPVTVSPYDGVGRAYRVDPEDGGYMVWSEDGETLGWTRGTGFYEKTVDEIVSGSSTARRTELAIEYEVDRLAGVVAMTNARVIAMDAARTVMDSATVVVDGGRIAAVGPDVEVPQGARVFDVRGSTIIPGLIDAHAHPHIDHSSLHVIEQAPAYLRGPVAYGVTTMIEVYGNEYRDGWLTDMIRAGKMTGPRFLTTGSVIYGRRQSGRLRMFRPIQTLDDAREQLRWNRDHGAIAVKDYSQPTRKRRHLVATAARELGLNVLSESAADPQMNLTQIMDGVTGLEHTMGLAPFHDDVVRFWAGTDAGMTPTLSVVYNGPMGEGWFHQAGELWEDPKLTNFIDPMSLMRVRRNTHLWPDDMYAWEMARELRKLYNAGTSLQLGAHGQMMGLGTHWELELFAGGDFPSSQILEIATIRGAEQHGLDAQIGSLEVGKLADLVVLDGNPLQDIRNVAQIRYVMKGGVLYSGTDAARVWPDPRPAPRPYSMRE
ncbi:MAG: amidohydrolase family protein [Gemmatimonadota bacterium]|nr:amidohydrolase family protein [Gemmatimonadota bacterium]